jgi:hypothetical protein
VIGGEIAGVGASTVVFEEAADDADVGVFGAAAEVLGAHDAAALVEEGVEGHRRYSECAKRWLRGSKKPVDTQEAEGLHSIMQESVHPVKGESGFLGNEGVRPRKSRIIRSGKVLYDENAVFSSGSYRIMPIGRRIIRLLGRTKESHMGLFGPSKMRIAPKEFVAAQLDYLFSAEFAGQQRGQFDDLARQISLLQKVRSDVWVKEMQNVTFNLLQIAWDRNTP